MMHAAGKIIEEKGDVRRRRLPVSSNHTAGTHSGWGRLLLLALIVAYDIQVAVAEGVVVNVLVVCTGSASFDVRRVRIPGFEARGIVRLVQVRESGRKVAEFSDNCTLQ